VPVFVKLFFGLIGIGKVCIAVIIGHRFVREGVAYHVADLKSIDWGLPAQTVGDCNDAVEEVGTGGNAFSLHNDAEISSDEANESERRAGDLSSGT
jgi:hypothetical protein